MNRHRRPFVPLLLGLMAALCLGGIGRVQARVAADNRGLPRTLPEPVAHAGVAPGVNVYLERYEAADLPATLAAIKSSGFGAIKQVFAFSPSFDWEAAGRMVAAAQDAGLVLVPLLDGDPAAGFAPPADPADFTRWAGEFAKRFGDAVDYYFVWDEPNLRSHWGGRDPDPAAYAALLSAAAAAIRGADTRAYIVAGPLAPTVERGPENLADALFLQALYDAGAGTAFDVVAAKPYGFETGPDDRRVSLDILNFSRAILLREVLEANGDEGKAVWAGNWGWNSLPSGWTGRPSIWGQVSEQARAEWTAAALERARLEWPWMGLMFLENWEPAAPEDDPRWGFAIAGRPTAAVLADSRPPEGIAYPGFRAARPDDLTQQYVGDWQFSPDFGADVSQSGDAAAFRFWGTDVGLRVRRAAYHARFYIKVDGRPANALPEDGRGAALVLNTPDPELDYLETVPVATGLEPGEHLLELVALRSPGGWPLNGFSAAYRPADPAARRLTAGLAVAAVILQGAAVWSGRQVDWRAAARRVRLSYDRLSRGQQAAVTALSAAIVALSGWLAWGEQAACIYRRLGNGEQLALTTLAASAFYFSPTVIFYLAALAALFALLYLRPAWGLALVAFAIPFHVKPKPMFSYQFSPVEVFLAVSLAAAVTAFVIQRLSGRQTRAPVLRFPARVISADYAALALTAVATLSLLFTNRLDVATNEWRVLVVESALFYGLMRIMVLEDDDVQAILDALVLGAVVVAVIGLYQRATGQNLITAEGGLMRLRSVFGSPNNVALYLGRVIPLLVATVLLGRGRRRLAYGLALVVTAVAWTLTYSKGGWFLGMPAALLVIFLLWRRLAGGRIWPWLAGLVVTLAIGLLIAFQIPALAGRLDPRGMTGFLRVSLWRSSVSMIRDHPVFGVGLDNFLYAYRGRYILDEAWLEPDQNHPHNIVLDFATRLGLAGLAAGVWLFISFLRVSLPLPFRVPPEWRATAVGILGGFAYMIAHGLVDHSFFLVDLAFLFYLFLGIAVWLQGRVEAVRASVTPN